MRGQRTASEIVRVGMGGVSQSPLQWGRVVSLETNIIINECDQDGTLLDEGADSLTIYARRYGCDADYNLDDCFPRIEADDIIPFMADRKGNLWCIFWFMASRLCTEGVG